MAHSLPAPVLRPLAFAWLSLVLLTLLSLLAGQGLHGQAGLPLLVAALLGLKGWLVIRHFLEVAALHPLLRVILQGFVAVTPLCLALTAGWGAHLARWAIL